MCYSVGYIGYIVVYYIINNISGFCVSGRVRGFEVIFLVDCDINYGWIGFYVFDVLLSD